MLIPKYTTNVCFSCVVKQGKLRAIGLASLVGFLNQTIIGQLESHALVDKEMRHVIVDPH